MASGNGDDRQQAAWERVEAKLDRLSDRVGGIEGRLTGLEQRVGAVEDRQLEQAAATDRLRAVIETLIYASNARFNELDARFDRLREDVIGGYADVAHRDLLAVQTLNEDKLTALERRVRALEEAR